MKDWLRDTQAFQSRVYGFDPAYLRSNVSAQVRAVRENVLPLMVEAVELLNNVSWKYWAHDEPYVNREEVLKESVDIGHFHANIMTAVDILDDEYWEAYRAKQRVNEQRQLDGYKVKEKK